MRKKKRLSTSARTRKKAISKTISYFPNLWKMKVENTKLRSFYGMQKCVLGKHLQRYQLAKRMGLKKILVLTFKPAVETAWDDDLLTHVDFEGWQFIVEIKTLHMKKQIKTVQSFVLVLFKII